MPKVGRRLCPFDVLFLSSSLLLLLLLLSKIFRSRRAEVELGLSAETRRVPVSLQRRLTVLRMVEQTLTLVSFSRPSEPDFDPGPDPGFPRHQPGETAAVPKQAATGI